MTALPPETSPPPMPAPPRRPAFARPGLAVWMVLALASPTGAQEPPPGLRPGAAGAGSTPNAGTTPASPADPSDRRAAVRAELDAVLRDIDLGKDRQAAIRAEIEAIARESGRVSEQLLATARRLREAEARLAVTEKRIADLDRDVIRSRRALEARRDVLADVLAALQRIGRKPPPAVVVRPEDALAAVRSAILVGALLPELRDQAEALLADLQSLEALKAAAATERERFHTEGEDLLAERGRLELLVEERRKARGEREASLREEAAKAAALAERATSLEGLVAALEKAATPAKPAPEITLATARGRLPLPVAGETILRWGQDDAAGLTAKGLSIAARAGAAVTSPCDGAVIFAGPFRSYGKLLIINAGGGYHVVLAGMERIDVEIGQSVRAGEPVGLMGSRPVTTAVSGGASDRPILYVEFRKDGTSIDPSPWWARARDEKVRG